MLELTRETYRRTVLTASVNAESYGDISGAVKEYCEWLSKNNVPGEISKAVRMGVEVYSLGSLVNPLDLARDIVVYMTVTRIQTLGKTLKDLKISDRFITDIEWMMTWIVSTTKPYEQDKVGTDLYAGDRASAKDVYIEVKSVVDLPIKPFKQVLVKSFLDTLMDRKHHRIAPALPATRKLLRPEGSNVNKEIELVERNQASPFPLITEFTDVNTDMLVVSRDISTMGMLGKITPSRVGSALGDIINTMMWNKEVNISTLINAISVKQMSLKADTTNSSESVSSWFDLQTVAVEMTTIVNNCLAHQLQLDLYMDNIIDDWQDLLGELETRSPDKTFKDTLISALSGMYFNADSKVIAEIPKSVMAEVKDGVISMCNYISVNKTATQIGLGNIDQRVLLSGAYHDRLLKTLYLLQERASVGRFVATRLYTLDAVYEIYSMHGNRRVKDAAKHSYTIRKI